MTVLNFDEYHNTQNEFKVTEVELVYHNKMKASERLQIRTSQDAYHILLRAWNDNKIELQEQCKVMLLDRKNGCMGISDISTGGIDSCIVDLKIVFATAIKASATGIILAHNHPSGNLTPSDADKKLTRRFVEAGQILDIKCLDHLIVTKDSYTSLADEGYMSGPL